MVTGASYNDSTKPVRDRVLVIMPNELEPYLAALSAVQALARESNAELWVARSHFIYLDEALPPCNFVDPYNRVKRGDYEMVCEFDVEAAYQLSIATERHMAQVFGIMVGSNPAPLPDLSKVKLGEALPNDTLWLKMNTNIAQLASAKMVVGVRCGFTYLAAALGKMVVEVYPRDRHKGWLSKWPKYAQLYGNVDEISEEQIEKAVEALWATTSDVRSTTQTEQLT